jgi:hypothetical protein
MNRNINFVFVSFSQRNVFLTSKFLILSYVRCIKRLIYDFLHDYIIHQEFIKCTTC